MGQSKFNWIFVYEDGSTEVVSCAWDELWDKIPRSNEEPIAVVRGDFS